MWSPFSPKKVEITSDQPNDQGDWSLRANGDTYRDRLNESKILTKRILQCSASVTGIAGQRGAGKSSLALRVLDSCEKNGAFTQLIHSPTAYDPRDFLLSVFQRLCDEVVARIDQKFDQATTLYDRGKAEMRRLSRIYFLIVASIVASVVIVQLLIFLYVSPTTVLEASRDRILDERFVFLATIFIVIIMFVITLVPRYVAKISRQIRNARKFPRETGLRKHALDLSEHLKFQTTLSNSTETGLSLLQLTSRLSKGKSLAARPLSLPGLTAQLSLFLKEIGEVYAGRVVICLDELDKIEDPRDLDKLLRGIKGVLGQPSTHFLLTVSEDALAGFMTRRRMDRGMLESAFEDIVLLERIDLEAAEYIVGLMYPKSGLCNTVETVHISTKLLWMFGGAIPREIKRMALLCLEADLNPTTSPPKKVWELLFQSRMSDMNSWASRVGGDNHVTYQFLCCLHESTRLLSKDNDGVSYDRKQARRFVNFWIKHYGDLFSVKSEDNAQMTKSNHKSGFDHKNNDFRLAVGRAVFEVLLGISGLVYVLKDEPQRLSGNLIEKLLEVFEFTPSNLAFAGKRMKEYLGDIGLLTNM